MNVAVAGLGGVGGFLGAKLARAYEDGERHRVHFLARGAHLDAILQNGLSLALTEETIVTRPWAAAADPGGWPVMDLILLCVKGFHLDSAARALEPIDGEDTVVLPLQNGVGKRKRVEAILSKGRIADGAIYVAANIQSPGVVVHAGGPGRVVFGREPQDVESLAPHRDLLREAGIPADTVTHVEVEVWNKFVFLCALAGTTALYGEPMGLIVGDREKASLVEGLMREVEALGRAQGVAMPEDIVPRSLAISRFFPPGAKSSLLHDLEQGRSHELDWLLGSAIAEGERLGVPLPLLRSTYRGIRSRWFGRS